MSTIRLKDHGNDKYKNISIHFILPAASGSGRRIVDNVRVRLARPRSDNRRQVVAHAALFAA